MLPRRTRLVWLLFFLLAFVGNEAFPQDKSWSRVAVTGKVIVLDPGHGGHAPGAAGPSGTLEKRVTFALAQKIQEALSETHTVHLTRDGDYWLDTEKRTAVANHYRADVFVSLHAGGSFQHKARGVTVFFYGANTARGLVPQQEGYDAESRQKLRPWDYIQIAHARESKLLANLIYGQLNATLHPVDASVRQAPCLALKGADMPAVLVEVGYMTHPAEEKQLADVSVMSDMANAIGQGIEKFVGQPRSCVNAEGMILEEDIATGRGAAW